MVWITAAEEWAHLCDDVLAMDDVCPEVGNQPTYFSVEEINVIHVVITGVATAATHKMLALHVMLRHQKRKNMRFLMYNLLKTQTKPLLLK